MPRVDGHAAGAGGRQQAFLRLPRIRHISHVPPTPPASPIPILTLFCLHFFSELFSLFLFFLAAQIFRAFCRLLFVFVVAVAAAVVFVECFGHRQKQKARTLNYENKMRCDAMRPRCAP